MSTILVISDTQAPYHHPDTLPFLTYMKDLYKPDHIVHIGDELDMRHFSKYQRNPDMEGVKEEVERGLEFMQKLFKLFPKCKVAVSNHTARIYIRASEAGIPTHFMKSYREWMGAPKGWSWHNKIEIEGIVFIHGMGLSGDGARLKACTLNQKSTVFGHIHSHAGVSWFSTR
jgi:predicted phosphodiesterase